MNQSLHGNLKSSSWFGKQKIIINHTYDSIKIDEIINKISTELDDKKINTNKVAIKIQKNI